MHEQRTINTCIQFERSCLPEIVPSVAGLPYSPQIFDAEIIMLGPCPVFRGNIQLRIHSIPACL